MTLTSYLSFIVLVITMVYTPGPMTMFMMANGMKMQYKNVWPILIGANNAYLVSIVVFTVGLTEILQKNMLIFTIVQIAGALYLLYLAYTQWNKAAISANVSEKLEITSKSSLYIKGVFIALSNPKAIILFGIVFPQFIIEGDDQLLQIIIFGATFLVLQFSSGWAYAYFGQRIKYLMEKPHYQNLLNRISAVVLIIVAGFLLVKL
jgi:homoserine/homoserine lactone efflux protein